ncbi:MAG: hypothetical protein UT08_C0018G0027 [Candidatus Woesebacteria bacterium GW2011_GWB1_38_8]|uniref:SpoVT-AbrB domain-containing protein n=1 Tax=Candidatus Woesebacteria bacterium GW2011_GWB1_38_8 TaxID=1618570 RepID=A0A0G0P524_9BACT|nr:MAG: hypothetical protein UT08_C0018G0027 [Candidatus Woesebacteria bacterium GW2011_GWB1_38_8]
MQIQTVFKAGNSNVVAIPKHLAKEINLKPGQKVVIEKAQNEEGLIIRKLEKSTTKKPKVDEEFKKWWKAFLKDNAEILDELALR